MLSHKPFTATESVLHAFGAPAAHPGAYSCGDAPLRGHEGIDFALPAGTPVVAVQAGGVLSLDRDGGDARFGRYVLLAHPWGQSLYANLAEVAPAIGAGMSVSGGEPMGRSGGATQHAPAHLHFGLRISPFSVADGFCGYSDPQPYLDRVSRGRGAIIGPHILGGVHQHLPALGQWQPRLITVVDPNPDEMKLLREACPQSVIVGRIFATDNEVSERIKANPEAAAQWAHELVLARRSPVVDYWQVANEVLSGRDELPLLARFEQARMALAAPSAYRCAIFAFSVGNPDLPEDERMGCWRLLYPALEQAEAGGHIVVVHQYGAPDLTQPTIDWHIHRLEHQVLRRLPFKRLQFAVTEFGIDGLLVQPTPKGWSEFGSAQSYVQQLLRAGRHLERYSGRVLGYSVFSLGVTGGWGSYDIRGEVTSMLAEQSERGTWAQVQSGSDGLEPRDGDAPTLPGGAPGSAPPEPPTPPAPPSEPVTPPTAMERRVGRWIEPLNLEIKRVDQRPDHPTGDIHYVVKDIFTTRDGSWEPSEQMGSVEQWARASYLKPFGAPDYFDDAGADHHIFAMVLGLDGKPLPDYEIRYWSDGFAQLGNPAYSNYTLRRTKTHSGWANIPMYGSNFYPESGQQGPWCWTPAGASEVVVGGGMPANHHVSFFVVWQAVQAGETLPLPEGFNVFIPWVHGESEPPQNETLQNAPLPVEREQAPAAVQAQALAQLRAEAWCRLLPQASAESAFAQYARSANLGAPLTPEFVSGALLAQAFAGGIVYAPLAAPAQISHIAW